MIAKLATAIPTGAAITFGLLFVMQALVTMQSDGPSEVHPFPPGPPGHRSHQLQACLLQQQAGNPGAHLPGPENQYTNPILHTHLPSDLYEA